MKKVLILLMLLSVVVLNGCGIGAAESGQDDTQVDQDASEEVEDDLAGDHSSQMRPRVFDVAQVIMVISRCNGLSI